MNPILYLHYRALDTDPWLVSPPMTLSSPATPAGGLPIAKSNISSGLQALPPESCLFSTDLPPLALDNYIALSATTLGLVKIEADQLLTFLINYKNAALYEAKFAGFVAGDFVTATIGRIEQFGHHGAFQIRFRLASQISS